MTCEFVILVPCLRETFEAATAQVLISTPSLRSWRAQNFRNQQRGNILETNLSTSVCRSQEKVAQFRQSPHGCVQLPVCYLRRSINCFYMSLHVNAKPASPVDVAELIVTLDKLMTCPDVLFNLLHIFVMCCTARWLIHLWPHIMSCSYPFL